MANKKTKKRRPAPPKRRLPQKLHEQEGVEFLDNNNLQSVNFFVPLPSSVRIPNGHTILFDEPDDGTIPDAIRFKNRQGLARRVRIRVLFQKVVAEHDTRHIQAGMEALRQFHLEAKTNEAAFKHEGQATVANLSYVTNRGDIPENERTAYFDEALAKLRDHLKAYYMVDRTPIELPTRTNLPPMILVTTEDVDSGGLRIPDYKPSDMSVFLLNTAIDDFVTTEDDLENGKLLSILHADAVMTADILNPYLDTFREATLAHRRGNTISASILYASSVEIILDALLMFLMWEEGKRPQEAYDVMYTMKMCACDDCKEKMITTLDRVNGGLYSERIGGDWSRKSEFMQSWRSLAELRNRVVHTGYEPDLITIDKYSEIALRLQTILTDYLVTAIHAYPLTAYFFAGQDGLKRRGLSPDLNDYIAEEIHKPTSMQSLFLNWRFEVERLHASKMKKTKDDNCQLAYLIHMSGQKEWILYDRKLKLFRIINEQTPSPATRANIQQLEKRIAQTQPLSSIIIEVRDVKPVVKTAKIKWHPLYLTSAHMHAIDRWPTSYLLPGSWNRKAISNKGKQRS